VLIEIKPTSHSLETLSSAVTDRMGCLCSAHGQQTNKKTFFYLNMVPKVKSKFLLHSPFKPVNESVAFLASPAEISQRLGRDDEPG